jgi:phenylpropionate dioxygenase-like ring-hydroxylating dioxygenase large terminal subunit
MFHPLCFTKDIPLDRPVSLRTFGKNWVLWRTLQTPDRIQCVEDRCSHRGAQLSKGNLTADGTLQCAYHGWEFNTNGKCVRVPQIKPGQTMPLSCHLKKPLNVIGYNGIVYASYEDTEALPAIPPPPAPSLSQSNIGYDGIHREGVIDEPIFQTDYLLEANYNFWIQIENLLDPAHIHFVHNGFQGDMAKAKYIRLVHLENGERHLEGTFTHDDPLVPDIRIRYNAPGTVDVCILGPTGETIRRNIIYTTPIEPGKCRVLFRDVAYKNYLVPDGWSFSKMLLGTGFVETTYQQVSESVIGSIMDQDIEILESQQIGLGGNGTLSDYLSSRELLLTESDRMILAFRQWCAKYARWLNRMGYM